MLPSETVTGETRLNLKMVQQTLLPLQVNNEAELSEEVTIEAGEVTDARAPGFVPNLNPTLQRYSSPINRLQSFRTKVRVPQFSSFF